MAFRLPFSLNELRHLLENETVFKRIPKITIDNFVKYFFPSKEKTTGNEANRGVSETSSGSDDSFQTSRMMNKTTNGSRNHRKSGSFNMTSRSGLSKNNSILSSPNSKQSIMAAN